MRFRLQSNFDVTAALLAACGSDGSAMVIPVGSLPASDNPSQTPAVSNRRPRNIDPQRPKLARQPQISRSSTRDGSVRSFRLPWQGRRSQLVRELVRPCQREIPEFQAAGEAHGDVVTFIGELPGERGRQSAPWTSSAQIFP
jgi:hypothetical protein